MIGAPIAAAAEPARLPSRMTLGDEFVHLLDLRGRIDARLGTLADAILDGNPAAVLSPAGAVPRTVQAGRALFGGGHEHG